jgi:hypothetical protein
LNLKQESHEENNRILEIFFSFIEIVVSIIAFFALQSAKKPDLAAISLIIGFGLAIGRFIISNKIESNQKNYLKELQSLKLEIESEAKKSDALLKLMEVYQSVKVDELNALIRAYISVGKVDLFSLRDVVLGDALQKLEYMSQHQKSSELSNSEYYKWLLGELEKAGVGNEIWAVSMMMECEWDDSPDEEQFLEKNINAVKNGVVLKRIFVVKGSDASLLNTNKGIVAHKKLKEEFPDRVDVRVVVRERLSERDPKLLRELADGFIAFDRRFALIDKNVSDGMRGMVTANPTEITGFNERFQGLRTSSVELTEFLTKNNNVELINATRVFEDKETPVVLTQGTK